MKNNVLIILTILMSLLLVACGKNDSKETNEEIVTKTIIENSNSEYKFLCSQNASKEIIYSLKTLANKIEAKTGNKFTCYRDTFESENKKEVLLGLTNRSESIKAYENLSDNEYGVKIVEECICIVGKTDALLILALYDFENNFINDSTYCNTGYLKVSSDKCKIKTLDGNFTVKKILDMGYTPYASIEKFITCDAVGDIKVGQGACSDGEYFYFIIRDSGDSKALIKKFDMDGKLVQTSAEIYLGHGNDMTYDSKRDCIVVAHGVSEANMYSIVNKNTLTVERTFEVESKGGGGSVTYNAKLDKFATSKGGETLSFYDTDFNYIKTVDRVVNDYTAQGIGSDEDYIYAPMSGSKDNVLVTYDWDGNFITNIIVETTAESETMFYSNGQYYLNFYVPGTGAVLYKMNFTIKYE